MKNKIKQAIIATRNDNKGNWNLGDRRVLHLKWATAPFAAHLILKSGLSVRDKQALGQFEGPAGKNENSFA